MRESEFKVTKQVGLVINNLIFDYH